MPRLLNPTGTVAIILGAYDWTKSGLVSAPSFRRSAAQLHRYLLTLAPYGLGLQPDLILNLFDDPSPAGAQLVRIRDTVRSFVRESREGEHPITDVLIYYVGHGSVDDRGHLHLLVKDSSEGIEQQSSIAAPDLAQVLRVAAPQQRRLVVLDCCFSEAATAAFGGMGTLNEAVAATALRDLEPGVPSPERGTLLLCSSPRRRVSIGLPNAALTLFTGTMLSVLREGSPSRRGEMLSFSDLRDDIYDRMLREYEGDAPRPALHQPDQQAGDLTRIPAFPNAASALRMAEEESQVAEARRVKEELAAAETTTELKHLSEGNSPEAVLGVSQRNRAWVLSGIITLFAGAAIFAVIILKQTTPTNKCITLTPTSLNEVETALVALGDLTDEPISPSNNLSAAIAKFEATQRITAGNCAAGQISQTTLTALQSSLAALPKPAGDPSALLRRH
jgi:hypothetical protein